ncbi:MAG: pentapeptide repeat-containing protein [Candidatus Thiodiazotropha sp. (ex Lucinoma kastoroae)]|nr:pentapeptide repeat-containing protein [Candidatus Thiodiazotropha sp. (ex Lucinoma kastoroae)]MCU7862239.1 pentapeptide repeat-containing protein [Candidatus Thiodiazotropha sp. (ex Lucinoma kastoroae)]
MAIIDTPKTIYSLPNWEPVLEYEGEDIAFLLEDYAQNENGSLRNLCLAGLDLRNISLEGKDLSGADFFRTNLRGANLKTTLLDGTNFSHASMQSADLCHAHHIGNALFCNTDMDNVRVFNKISQRTIRLTCFPIQLSGLPLPVVILDDMIAVGCEFLHAVDWLSICKDKENEIHKELKNNFEFIDDFCLSFGEIIDQILLNRDSYYGHRATESPLPNDNPVTVIIKNDYKKLGEKLIVSSIVCPAGVQSDMNIGDTIDKDGTKTFYSPSHDRMFFKLKSVISGIELKFAVTAPQSSKNSATGYGSGGLEKYNPHDNATFTFHPGDKDKADWDNPDAYTGSTPPDYGDC